MSMTTRGTGQDVASSLVSVLFNEALLEYSTKLNYKEWGCNDFEMDLPDEKIQGLSGPGPATLTTEGVRYGSTTLYRGYPKDFSLLKWTEDLAVTEELIHWLSKSPSKKRVSELRSMTGSAVQGLNFRIDEMVAKLYYMGFATTFFTGGDSVALFSASHPIRKTGGTQSNIITSGGVTSPAFSPSALVAAISQLNRLVGPSGMQLLPVTHARILCSVEKLPEVDQVLRSEYGPLNNYTGKSSASSEAFKARGTTIDVKCIDKMPATYKDYWFVVAMDRCSPYGMGPHLGIGWKPEMKDSWEYGNGTMHTYASTFCGPSIFGAEWVVGSQGTG